MSDYGAGTEWFYMRVSLEAAPHNQPSCQRRHGLYLHDVGRAGGRAVHHQEEEGAPDGDERRPEEGGQLGGWPVALLLVPVGELGCCVTLCVEYLGC